MVSAADLQIGSYRPLSMTVYLKAPADRHFSVFICREIEVLVWPFGVEVSVFEEEE